MRAKVANLWVKIVSSDDKIATPIVKIVGIAV